MSVLLIHSFTSYSAEPAEKFPGDDSSSDDSEQDEAFEEDFDYEAYLMRKRKRPRTLKKSQEVLAQERKVFEERLAAAREAFDVADLLPLSLSVDETLLALSLKRCVVGRVGDFVYEVMPVSVPAEEQVWTDANDLSAHLAENGADVSVDRRFIFHDLHSRGYTMVDGMRYSATWLCYKGDPLRTHADLMVVHVPRDAHGFLRPVDLTLLTTISNKTNKTCVLSTVCREANVVVAEYLKIARRPVNLPRVYGR